MLLGGPFWRLLVTLLVIVALQAQIISASLGVSPLCEADPSSLTHGVRQTIAFFRIRPSNFPGFEAANFIVSSGPSLQPTQPTVEAVVTSGGFGCRLEGNSTNVETIWSNSSADGTDIIIEVYLGPGDGDGFVPEVTVIPKDDSLSPIKTTPYPGGWRLAQAPALFVIIEEPTGAFLHVDDGFIVATTTGLFSFPTSPLNEQNFTAPATLLRKCNDTVVALSEGEVRFFNFLSSENKTVSILELCRDYGNVTDIVITDCPRDDISGTHARVIFESGHQYLTTGKNESNSMGKHFRSMLGPVVNWFVPSHGNAMLCKKDKCINGTFPSTPLAVSHVISGSNQSGPLSSCIPNGALDFQWVLFEDGRIGFVSINETSVVLEATSQEAGIVSFDARTMSGISNPRDVVAVTSSGDICSVALACDGLNYDSVLVTNCVRIAKSGTILSVHFQEHTNKIAVLTQSGVFVAELVQSLHNMSLRFVPNEDNLMDPYRNGIMHVNTAAALEPWTCERQAELVLDFVISPDSGVISSLPLKDGTPAGLLESECDFKVSGDKRWQQLRCLLQKESSSNLKLPVSFFPSPPPTRVISTVSLFCNGALSAVSPGILMNGNKGVVGLVKYVDQQVPNSVGLVAERFNLVFFPAPTAEENTFLPYGMRLSSQHCFFSLSKGSDPRKTLDVIVPNVAANGISSVWIFCENESEDLSYPIDINFLEKNPYPVTSDFYDVKRPFVRTSPLVIIWDLFNSTSEAITLEAGTTVHYKIDGLDSNTFNVTGDKSCLIDSEFLSQEPRQVNRSGRLNCTHIGRLSDIVFTHGNASVKTTVNSWTLVRISNHNYSTTVSTFTLESAFPYNAAVSNKTVSVTTDSNEAGKKACEASVGPLSSNEKQFDVTVRCAKMVSVLDDIRFTVQSSDGNVGFLAFTLPPIETRGHAVLVWQGYKALNSMRVFAHLDRSVMHLELSHTTSRGSYFKVQTDDTSNCVLDHGLTQSDSIALFIAPNSDRTAPFYFVCKKRGAEVCKVSIAWMGGDLYSASSSMDIKCVSKSEYAGIQWVTRESFDLNVFHGELNSEIDPPTVALFRPPHDKYPIFLITSRDADKMMALDSPGSCKLKPHDRNLYRLECDFNMKPKQNLKIGLRNSSHILFFTLCVQLEAHIEATGGNFPTQVHVGTPTKLDVRFVRDATAYVHIEYLDDVGGACFLYIFNNERNEAKTIIPVKTGKQFWLECVRVSKFRLSTFVSEQSITWKSPVMHAVESSFLLVKHENHDNFQVAIHCGAARSDNYENVNAVLSILSTPPPACSKQCTFADDLLSIDVPNACSMKNYSLACPISKECEFSVRLTFSNPSNFLGAISPVFPGPIPIRLQLEADDTGDYFHYVDTFKPYNLSVSLEKMCCSDEVGELSVSLSSAVGNCTISDQTPREESVTFSLLCTDPTAWGPSIIVSRENASYVVFQPSVPLHVRGQLSIIECLEEKCSVPEGSTDELSPRPELKMYALEESRFVLHVFPAAVQDIRFDVRVETCTIHTGGDPPSDSHQMAVVTVQKGQWFSNETLSIKCDQPHTEKVFVSMESVPGFQSLEYTENSFELNVLGQTRIKDFDFKYIIPNNETLLKIEGRFTAAPTPDPATVFTATASNTCCKASKPELSPNEDDPNEWRFFVECCVTNPDPVTVHIASESYEPSQSNEFVVSASGSLHWFQGENEVHPEKGILNLLTHIIYTLKIHLSNATRPRPTDVTVMVDEMTFGDESPIMFAKSIDGEWKNETVVNAHENETEVIVFFRSEVPYESSIMSFSQVLALFTNSTHLETLIGPQINFSASICPQYAASEKTFSTSVQGPFGSNESYLSHLWVTCNEGMYLEESISTRVFCDGTGWQGGPFSCTPATCTPYEPQNDKGKIVDSSEVTSFLLHDNITIKCDRGYVINQDPATSPGEVQKSEMAVCSAGDNDPNGKQGSWKRVPKNEDYRGAPLSCSAIDCWMITKSTSDSSGGLMYVPNSQMTLNSTTLHSIVSFSCHDGFISRFKNSSQAKCESSGYWEWIDPLSQPACEPLGCFDFEDSQGKGGPDLILNVRNVTYSMSKNNSDSSYGEGTIATFICEEGFRHQSNGMSQDFVTCGPKGWSRLNNTCYEISCSPEGKKFKYQRDGADLPGNMDTLPFRTEAFLDCDLGRNPQEVGGEKRSPPPPRVCNDTGEAIGEWKGPKSECVLHVCPMITCPSDMPPECNATITYVDSKHQPFSSNQQHFERTFGSYAIASCEDPDFEVKPSTLVVQECRERGKEWSGMSGRNKNPICAAKMCQNISGNALIVNYVNETHGSLRINTTAILSCEEGKVIEGDSKLVCQRGGWYSHQSNQTYNSTNYPRCEYPKCDKLSPVNGIITYTDGGNGYLSVNATATLECESGFSLPSTGNAFVCDGVTKKWVSYQALESVDENPDLITCNDINECDESDTCPERYSNGVMLPSKCFNTKGSYACSPIVTEITVRGVNYQNGIPSSTSNKTEIFMPSTSPHQLHLSVIPGLYNKTVELSLKEIKFGHYTCDIKLDISGKKSVACLAPAAIGEKHVLQFQYCLGTTPDPCPWHETDFFISYHGPVLTPSSLRSHSRDQSFGTHHLVSATSFGESIQMTGSNFPAENDVSSIQIVFGTLESLSGPRPLETNRKCSITDLKPDQFVCDMNVTEASSETSLHFLVDVLGRQVISKDVYSFVSPVSISSIEPVEGCDVEDGNVVRCNTDGSATVKIRGNGFLPPLRVLVDGGTCIIAKESENEIVCKLPTRSGQNLAVTVFSGSLNAEYQSISFSTPAISAIDSSICEPEVKSEDSGQGSTRLKKCDRSGNAMLTVHGDFFGKEGAHVYVGSDACTSVVHQKGNEQKLLTCIIPGGSQIDLPVVVFQSGGFSDGSILLSYVQCPIGERNDGILCKKCDPGTFTNSEGQDECRACAPGTFMSVSGSSECIPCPPGRYSGHGASECTACPLGTFSAGHASECTICSVGSYSSSPAATACLPCPHGATSDSDFAGCRCLPGFFMNYLRQCEECMPGGDCSDIGSTYFSILPLPGFYPTTLATDSSAPRVLRFKMTIRTDLPLDTMGGRNNLLLFLMRSIYESNNIDRNRVVIRSVEAISISDVAVFDPSKLAQLLSRGDGTIASQQQFQTTLAEASTLGSSGVPGAVVVIDINPGMRKESVPNKDIMLEILRLLTNETSLMFGMFRSNTTSLMIDSEYHRSAFTFFEECLSDACVGGPVLCAKGYTGPLCSVCTAKYTKTSTYECQYCGTRESLYRSIAVSLGILLLVCALFVIAVAGDTLNSIDYPRVLRPIPFSAIIRMVACAVQTWAIAAQFDMQWSGILSDLMIFLSAYGNIGLNAITLDCFSSNLEGHGSAETVRPLFLTAIAALALPVFAMVFPLLLLFPAYYIHRSYYLRHLRHLGDQLEQYNIIDRNTETMSSRKVQTGITSTAALSARRAIAGNFSPQPQFYSSPLASPHPPPFPVDVNVQTEKDTSAVNSRQKAISLKDIAAESQERIPLSKGAIQSKNHGRTQQANGDKPATPHTLTSTGSMSVLVPQESNAPSVGSLNLQMCDISKRQKRIKDAYMFLYVGFVVVALYLLHPSICRAFFRLVACKVVGFSSLNALDRFVRDDNGSLVEYKAKDFALPRASKLLVLADMGLECFSGEHFVWVFTLGLLILLLWVIGIPLTFYYFVRNNVQILRCAPRVPTEDDRNRRARFLYGFSFLFVGYQPRWYLWFLVEMAAKVAYVALSIFIPGQMHTQLLLASFVSFVTVAVQGLALPFDCTILEFFGFVSLLVVFGLFFQANFFFIDLEISDEQKEKLTSLIFASFFLFLGVTICVIALVIYKNIKAKKTWDDFQEAVKRGDDPTSILRRWHKANKGKVEFGRKIGMTAFEIASEIENYLNIVSVMNTSVSLSSSVAVASFSITETKHIQEINDIDVLTSESETSDAADEDKDSESSSSTSSCDSSCSCHDSETKDGCNETPPAPALFPGAKKNLHVSIDSSCSTDDDDIDDPPSWTRRAPSPTGRNRSKRVPQPLAAKSSLSE